MNDPRQQLLFNYMDPEYDVNWDDMEGDDYNDVLFTNEYDAYLDSLTDE